jgi:TIR domain
MPHDMPFDVFLSHSSHDKPVVRALAERLKQDGLRVWFDEWEIEFGDSISSKVEEGLENSRILIFCMSANAFGSDWAILETQTVRFRDPLNRNRRFIPLRLDDAPVKGTLAQFKYVDWRGQRDDAYRGLLKACARKEAESVHAGQAASASVPETPAVILPTDTERIAQTRLAILNCLKREHFAGLPNLGFAPHDDMPDLLAKAFSEQAGSMQRVAVADRCVYAVLEFGRAVVAAFGELPAAAPAATLKNKHQCWKYLVNAMQHAILLGARQNYTANRRINDAFNGNAPCAVEGMSWLSASVIMRKNLADNLRSNPGFPVHAPDPAQDPMEDCHADDWSEIEMGTGEPARVQAYKAIKYMLDRGSFPDQPTQRQVEELQGEVKLRKRDGLHLLVFNQKPDCFPPEFIGWLNTRMHVGTITILASNGEFDLPEGEWRACLAELLKVMREFEPPPIRSRIH